MFQLCFLPRYFLRRYSFPYDESNGIEHNRQGGREGGEGRRRNHDVLHALPYHVENFASYQDLTSDYIQSRLDFHARFLRKIRRSPRRPESEEKIHFLPRNLYAVLHKKKKNKTHIFLVERFISSTCSTTHPPKIRESPRREHRASGDRRGSREARLTIAEEPSRVCGGNEGVDISARAP